MFKSNFIRHQNHCTKKMHYADSYVLKLKIIRSMKIIVMFKMSQLKVALFAIKGNAEDMDQLGNGEKATDKGRRQTIKQRSKAKLGKH
jgi:hypothetical protein